jgi:hypothetical protein
MPASCQIFPSTLSSSSENQHEVHLVGNENTGDIQKKAALMQLLVPDVPDSQTNSVL